MSDEDSMLQIRIKRAMDFEERRREKKRIESGKPIRKKTVSKKIVVPAMTLLFIAMQNNPEIFKSEDDTFIMDFLNYMPTSITVVRAEEVPDYGYNFQTEDDTEDLGKYSYVVQVKKSVDWQGNEFTQGVSEDKKTYTNASGHKRTTVKGLTNYPELREKLLTDYGKNMYSKDKWGEKVFWTNNNMSMLAHTGVNHKLRSLLNTSSGRKELSEYAIYVDGIESTDPAAPEAILATFYGIVNDEEGLCPYKSTGKVSRLQFYTMFIKYNYGIASSATDPFENWKTQSGKECEPELHEFMGKNNKYTPWAGAAATSHIFEPFRYFVNEDNKYAFTKKELGMGITRLEVLHQIKDDGGMPNKYSVSESKKGLDKVFKDITSNSFYNNNKARNRQMLVNKKLTDEEAQIIYACYKAGMLKPDANGNSRLFNTATFADVLKMLDGWSKWCNN